ncbi:MAG: hypothetical protein CMP81_18380 [Fulvimarina sp.]|nr:hypothetical protein [Fulvimarina sp.]
MPAVLRFDALARVARTGVPERVDGPVAGSRRQIEAHAFRIGPGTHRTLGVLFRDIGRQRRAEEELKERSDSPGLIVENARNCAIFATDPQGLITAWYAGAGASAPNFWNAR